MEYLFFLIPAAVIALAFILYFRRENVRAKQSPATQKKQAIIDSLKVQTRTASGVRTSARQTPAAAFLELLAEHDRDIAAMELSLLGAPVTTTPKRRPGPGK